MSETELVNLKERVALRQPLKTKEINYVLDAINTYAYSTTIWTCGHAAGAMCAECYHLLAAHAHQLAEENLRLKEQPLRCAKCGKVIDADAGEICTIVAATHEVYHARCVPPPEEITDGQDTSLD